MLTFYSKNNCGYCIQAKTMCKTHDIPFEEINIEDDADAYNFIIGEGHRTMPQVYINGECLEGGYTGMKAIGPEDLKILVEKNTVGTSTLGSI